MKTSRRAACVWCGDGEIESVALSPREAALLMTSDGVPIYCRTCGSRHHATWQEKRYLRQVQSRPSDFVEGLVHRQVERVRGWRD